MKYGETLRQRSIPEWNYYNIDYDEIKHIIKENTTPGKGKALSIPGQGSDAERDFEHNLYKILHEEHDRIGLFVKSKSLEIQRRLEHLNRKLRLLELRNKSAVEDSRSLRPERYGKVEQEAINAGEEIRSLSRFIGAQRLAFAKLLKKYKKWTGSDALETRFKAEVLSRPNSFTTVTLDESLDHWTEILQVIRAGRMPNAKSRGLLLSAKPRSPSLQPHAHSGPRKSSSAITCQLDKAISSASDVRFDVAFAETSIGESGTRAVYWVHQEQLIELQVVMLQQLRLYLPNSNQASAPSSLSQSPIVTRRSSLSRHQEGQIEKDNDSGVIVLDQLEEYARRQSIGTVSDCEDVSGKPFLQPAATARWATSDEAILSISQLKESGKAGLATVRKKHLSALLNVDRDFTPWRTSGTSTPIDGPSSSLERDALTLDEARGMLSVNSEVKPLAAIFSKRTRFVGLSNTSSAGQWCVLDSQIYINKVSRDDLVGKDWAANLASTATSFPYAVLEVRQEGKLAKTVIDVLDKSHLTERVRGFSLASHAIWQCWKPKSMSPPFWLPVLNKDIRKIPEAVPKFRRQTSQIQNTSNKTSTSSEYDQTGSSTAFTTGESSSTSVPTTPVESHAFGEDITNKKKKVSYHQDALRKEVSTLKIPETRYWNEYDHPEDGSDDENGYYIYMDPNANEKFIGQETAEILYSKMKSIFKKRKALIHAERQTLVSPHLSDGSSSPTSSDDDATHRILPPVKKNRQQSTSTTYGTIANRSYIPSLDVVQSGSSPRLLITFLSLTASTIICLIISMLAATGKKKLKGEVDAGILLGVVGSLFFALVGMVSVVTGREKLGIVKWTVIGTVFAAICVADGVLVGWVAG